MCDFACKTFDELLDHMNSYHPDSTDFTKCADCDKEYDSYKKLSKEGSFSYFFQVWMSKTNFLGGENENCWYFT